MRNKTGSDYKETKCIFLLSEYILEQSGRVNSLVYTKCQTYIFFLSLVLYLSEIALICCFDFKSKVHANETLGIIYTSSGLAFRHI